MLDQTAIGLKTFVTIAARKRSAFMFSHMISIIPLHCESFLTHFTPVAIISSMVLIMQPQSCFVLECFYTTRALVPPCKGVEHFKDVAFVLHSALFRV